MDLGSLDLKEILRKRDTQLTIAFAVVVLVGYISFYGYRWYKDGIARSAQKAFSESMETYKQALMLDQNKKVDETNKPQNMWEEAELAFRAGYLQNQKSTLAPFFLVFESEVQNRLGKTDLAYKTLSEAIEILPKSSPYYNFYKVKQALFEIDKKDELKGVSKLDELSKDDNNNFRDMAAYYLGEYFWSKNEFEKAKAEYKLAESFNPESVWSGLASKKLQKVSA